MKGLAIITKASGTKKKLPVSTSGSTAGSGSKTTATSASTGGGGGGGKYFDEMSYRDLNGAGLAQREYENGAVLLGGHIVPGGTVTSDGVSHDKYVAPRIVYPGSPDYPSGVSGGSGTGTKNASATVQNAMNTVQNATGALNAMNYDTGKISNQQEALDMMKLGSSLWNGTTNKTLQDTYAKGNQLIASQWFPGSYNQYGTWYDANGSPLYGGSSASGSGTANANDTTNKIYKKDLGTRYYVDKETGRRYDNPLDASRANGQTLWQNHTAQPSAYEYVPFEQTEMGQAAQADYQNLLNQIQNYKAFEYDPLTDPAYQQYVDTYTRSGQRAMSDVLGQLAARTGGMASSYAGTMAQQQYDQYMQELANKVPELRQLAYSMYADDYNRLLGQYDRGYQRYSDDFNRYMDQVGLDYNIYRDQVGDTQWEREMALKELQNQQGMDQWTQQFNWNKETGTRDYDRSVYENDRNFDYQKQLDEYNRQLTERQYGDAKLADLWDQVNRHGRIPTLASVLAAGGTEADYQEMVIQGKHARAADASRYYSGW